MPELPEAEANRLAIEEECLNRTIEAAEPGDNVTYVELPGDNERKRLLGHRFTQTQRHGKMIFAGSKTGPWIAVHLGMTGRLMPFDEDDGVPRYAKFIIRFEGDRRLAFLNKRKLGWLKVIDDPAAFVEAEGYGPDAMAISRDDFASVIGGTNGAIKSALMDQRKLAGIGNLWSDEMLMQTGVDPRHTASDLSQAKLDALFDAMHEILKAVSKTRMDYSRLPDDWLIADRNEGADCPRCDGSITKATVGGRTAYFCQKHQE